VHENVKIKYMKKHEKYISILKHDLFTELSYIVIGTRGRKHGTVVFYISILSLLIKQADIHR